MEIASLLGHSAQLLHITKKSNLPSDQLASEYFRQRKYIGSHDRRFISSILFFTLRSLLFVEEIAHSSLKKIIQDSYSKINAEIQFIDLFSIISAYILKSISEKYQENISEDNINYPSAKNFILPVFIDKSTFIEGINQLKQSLSEPICRKFALEDTLVINILNNIEQDLSNYFDVYVKICENNEIDLETTKKMTPVITSIPDWVFNTMISNPMINKYDRGALELAESLLHPAPLTLRANVNPDKRGRLIEELRKSDIDCTTTDYSPIGINIKARKDLTQHPLFKSGLIDVQDEGSQLIGIALDPENTDRILDACAGAGGKTLLIAQLQTDSGEIVSSDVELSKLKELNKRTSKSGLRSVTTILSRNLEKEYRFESFDKVLVDAPCSGMGTVRRSPMLKWRLTPELLNKYQAKQMQILEYYSRFVATGGTLLYSTCSIMKEENTDVITYFLDKHNNFKVQPLLPAFNKFDVKNPGIDENDFELQLLPSVHGCDGFYMAKLIRED